MSVNNARASLFVGTSVWADPVLQNISQHPAMDAYARQIRIDKRPLVTTDDVLGKLVALLTVRGIARPRLLQFVEQIMSLTHLQIVHVDEATIHEAWELLKQRQDKTWSLVDACSFLIMRRLTITEAFTSDHHFVQAGFIRVPFQS
ncbi:MAG TPA: PIN domain-containing protein [Ktedonobacterales bacterium]|nr:PIN domain-containing protein [Ktedonobacterales bacterium]